MGLDKDNRNKYKKKAVCPEFIQELLDIGNLSGAEAEEVHEYSFIFDLLTCVTRLSANFRRDKHQHTKESFYAVPIFPTQVSYEYNHEEKGFSKTPTIKPAATVDLVVTSDGIMNFQLMYALDTLQGESIQSIRSCVICKKFFWAKKSNADTCSQKCAKTLYDHKRAAKKRNATEERERWKNQDFSKKENK